MLFPAFFFTFVALTYCAKLPPSFQKCNRKQPDLKECLLKAAQDGISQLTEPVLKEFNFPNVNPLEIPEATISAGTGPVQVQQNFTNCKFYGFPSIKYDAFDWDLEKKTWYLGGLYPELKINCNYNLDGKILLLIIKGTGPGSVVMKNLLGYSNLTYEEVRKKGKTYMKFVTSGITMEPESVYFNFENLFDGDKQLGDNINKVLNENWKEVFDDLRSSYSEIVARLFKQFLNILFSKVSIEELLD
ncbi:hypothetical protein Zmor_016996 [Zophobas morio]|uniref:Uncharacterized protein n=1 Tax=Zophobas morio TaxID=2755281 RepID=A0AA38IAI7_9CUCU|nr:hypothetical protein Zmor_016996 [Zophobas morio]